MFGFASLTIASPEPLGTKLLRLSVKEDDSRLAWGNPLDR